MKHVWGKFTSQKEPKTAGTGDRRNAGESLAAKVV